MQTQVFKLPSINQIKKEGQPETGWHFERMRWWNNPPLETFPETQAGSSWRSETLWRVCGGMWQETNYMSFSRVEGIWRETNYQNLSLTSRCVMYSAWNFLVFPHVILMHFESRWQSSSWLLTTYIQLLNCWLITSLMALQFWLHAAHQFPQWSES